MIKLKNILAENNNNEVLLRARIALSRHGYTPMVVKNMTREDMIRTLKKLSSDRSNDAELDDIAVKLQGIKTNNLIVPDTDQNNNGYPDSTETSKSLSAAGRAENQLKVSGYITPTMRTSDEGSANSLMILFSGTDNFMDRIAVNVFKKYGFDKTSINRSYDPNDGIVEFKVALSNEIADKISNELERADRGTGNYGGYIIIKK